MEVKKPLNTTDSTYRFLLTGGCGFIGLSLIDRLLNENPEANIRILDNLSVGTREELLEITSTVEKELGVKPSGVEFVEGDIRDYDICTKCCEGINVVVHLAANTGVAPSIENPRYDMEANVTGIFNMLEAARQNQVKKFIFASSGAAIGEVTPPIHEDKVPRPVSPYGASKLAGEAYCSSYYLTFGINTISLRFANVYGPLSKHKNSVVAKFFKHAFAGEPLEIYGNGEQTRDFIYITDLIQAIMLSVNSDVGGEVFQIATYRETTVNEIADKIKKIIEINTGKNVSVVHGETRLGDVKRNYSDISKAKRMLGFLPEYTLDMGLQKTFDYFSLKNKR
ncbi:NAD-dependent epimerase/dehydratase family protein [candidate division WS5 bacterium]|uniref:NAD-dependent epimerase/dehydratase family protein n=1 Tax=candidate division WS5 bacterium TaxID=2093353 RepID=A0A419D9Q5_9BACT|nr:MAG: NAD-dependent epimerase/dehydratase family protein [candidate division WS5 bacterium]